MIRRSLGIVRAAVMTAPTTPAALAIGLVWALSVGYILVLPVVDAIVGVRW